MARRPHHKGRRKVDSLTRPDQAVFENAIWGAVAPFDGKCREMDLKWGIDRLPELVSTSTAAIWGKTMANLNAAIQASWSAEDQDQARADVMACVASALKGFEVMDAEAEAANQPKADTRVFEFEHEGTRLGVVADEACWPAVKANRPDLVIYTMREVANALEAYGATSEVIKETKAHFPGAQITDTKPPVDYANGGDPINF